MNKENVECPRCHKTFLCKANTIENCDCSKIVLSNEERIYVSFKFKGCLCTACLKELRSEYSKK